MEYHIKRGIELGICDRCGEFGDIYWVTMISGGKSVTKSLCRNCAIKAKEYADRKNKSNEAQTDVAQQKQRSINTQNSAPVQQTGTVQGKFPLKPVILALTAVIVIAGIAAGAYAASRNRGKPSSDDNTSESTVFIRSESKSPEDISELYEKYTDFPETGPCGENAIWKLSADKELLVVTGTGSLKEYRINKSEEKKDSLSPDQTVRYIIIEEGITYLPKNSIESFLKLESLYLPSTLTEIEDGPFFCCKNLSKVYFPNGSRNFKFDDGLLLSADGKDLYSYTGPRKGTSFTVPRSVETIHSNAFYNAVTLETIKVPSTVRLCKTAAFSICNSLMEVYIDDGVAIGEDLFFGCEFLESARLPSDITTIPQGTFHGCESLRKYEVGRGITKIGYIAFKYCINLETVILPDTLEEIDGLAFADCEKLKNINLPSSLKYLGFKIPEYTNAGVFAGCVSLESIIVPAGVNITAKELFYEWTPEQTVYFRDSAPSPGWNSDWNEKCEANIVWGYNGI